MSEEMRKSSDTEWNLAEFLRVIWKNKVMVIGGTFLATVIAIAVCLLLPRIYRGEGLFKLSGYSEKFSAADLKGYMSIFQNPEGFLRFVREGKYFDEKQLRRLTTKFKEPKDLAKWLRPVYSYTRDDIKELGKISKDEVNFVLGLKISSEETSPERAVHFVKVLGEFIQDSIRFVKLFDLARRKYNGAIDGLQKNANLILEQDFQLRQLEKKRVEIQSILRRYPDAGKMENWQVISVDNSGYRYLSPVAQLIGIESNIADVNRIIALYQREKKRAEIEIELFSRLKDFCERNHSGQLVWTECTKLKNDFFAKRDMEDDVLRGVYNELSSTLTQLHGYFTEEIGYGGDLPLPKDPVAPKRRIIVLVTFLASFLFFVAWSLWLDWWTRNKKTIVSQ